MYLVTLVLQEYQRVGKKQMCIAVSSSHNETPAQ